MPAAGVVSVMFGLARDVTRPNSNAAPSRGCRSRMADYSTSEKQEMSLKVAKALLGVGAGVLLVACEKPATPPPAATAPPPVAAAPAAPTPAPAAPPPAAPAPEAATPPAAAPGAPPPSPPAAAKPPANAHSVAAGISLAPAPKPTQLNVPAPSGGKVPANFVGAVASLPADWRTTAPANPLRVAQFATPPAKNGESAEMVVFYFAAGRGGTQAENIGRWTSQFTSPNGGTVEPKVSKTQVNNMAVTRVELAGNYARGVGMGAEAQAKPDQTLLAAIVTTPTNGNVTLHFFGNKDAVREFQPAFEEVVASLKSSGH